MTQKNTPRNSPSAAPDHVDVPRATPDTPIDRQLEQQNKKVDAAADAIEDRSAAKAETIDRTAEQLALMKIDAKTWKKMTPKEKQDAVKTFETSRIQASSFTEKTKTFLHGVGDTAETVTETILPTKWTEKMSDNQKMAAGIAMTAGAGIILYKGLKWLFGRGKDAAETGKDAAKKTKGGFLKKLLIGAGIGLAAFFGGKYLLEKFTKDLSDNAKNSLPTWLQQLLGGGEDDKSKPPPPFFDPKTNNPLMPDSLEAGAEGLYNGAPKGLETATEIFGMAANALLEHENVSRVLSQKEKYKTNREYVWALLEAMVVDSIDIVVDELSVTIYIGGKMYEVSEDFAKQVWELWMDDEEKPANMSELFATYVQGSIVYATSLATLKLVTINRIGKNARVLLETGLWPVYTLKRGSQAGWKLFRSTTELANSNSATRLTLRRMDAAMSRNGRLRVGRWLNADADGLMMRYDFAQAQQRLLEKAEHVIKNEDSLKLFKTNREKAIDEFRTYLQGMKKGDIPQEFMDAYKSVTDADISKLTRAQTEDILNRMGRSGTEAPFSATYVDDVPEPKKAPRPQQSTRATMDEGGPVRKPQPEIVPVEKPALKVFAGEEMLDEAAEALSTEVNDLINDIKNAPKSGKPLADIALSADPSILAEAAKHSDEARVLKESLDAAKKSAFVGKGIIAIDFYITYTLISANRVAIQEAREKGDEDAVRILEMKERSLAMAGGADALATLGLTSLSAALPVGVILGGGTWYADRLYDHAIELNKASSHEYRKKTSAELVRDVYELNTWEVEDPATGSGKETRKIRRQEMMEAYLYKNVSVITTPVDGKAAEEWFDGLQPDAREQQLKAHGSTEEALKIRVQQIAAERLTGVVRNGMRAADVLTKGEFTLPENAEGQRDPLATARTLSSLYALKQNLVDLNAPLQLSYLTAKGVTHTLDISRLPDALPTSDSSEEWNEILQLTDEFRQYELAMMKQEYLAAGEIEGWENASEFARQKLYARWAEAIAFADSRIAQMTSGPENAKQNAVRLEVRRKIQSATVACMSVMAGGEKEADFLQLQKIDSNIQNWLHTFDAEQVWNEANADQVSTDFNVFKYILEQSDQAKVSAISAPGKYDMTIIKPLAGAEKRIQNEFGTSSSALLTSLLTT